MGMLEEAISEMRMRDLIFEKISFYRKDFVSPDVTLDVRFESKKELAPDSDSEAKITLKCQIDHPDNDFKIEIIQSAIFTIDPKSERKEILFGTNAIAIMFPYMRSQITLLTSQPNFGTVSLPILNINKLKIETLE